MHEERIPSPIREAVRDAAVSRDTFSVACRVFVDDASASCPTDQLARGRLEQAIARATLEAWRARIGNKVIEGGAYGSRLVTDLVVKKYWESIPLYRQNEALERLGLSMPSASMDDQFQWVTELLRPIWRHLLALVLHADVMHVDGTSLPVRARDHPNGIVTGALPRRSRTAIPTRRAS